MPTKAINLRIDTELLEYLQKRADEEHRTLSNMIISILLDDKAKNGIPSVEVGDNIVCRDGQAVILDINGKGTWTIKWQDGEEDVVPMLLQHNWKRL